MATTAQNVFDYAMSLIDERLATGLVDSSTTAIFKKNTPYILTMLQDELVRKSDYYKTYSITKAVTDNQGDYQEYDMPTDFQTELQIIEVKTDGVYRSATDFKWEGKSKLFIADAFAGTIKIVYYPIPDAITALTDILVLDDITCRTTLVNGLASRLLTNENRVMSNFFGDIYNELKTIPVKNKLGNVESIQDVYDSKLTY